MALAIVLPFLLLLLFVTGAAHAGFPTLVQTHAFKLSGTVLTQGVSAKTGDDILDREKISEKSFGANCVQQEKLRKDQSVVLLLNDACGDINNNEIQVVSTEPPSTTRIGDIYFELDNQIVNEKNGKADTRTVPVVVDMDCNGTVAIDVIASAIATIKLGNQGLCLAVQSMKLKNASGYGSVADVDVIVDRVTASASKPSN